MYHNNWLGSMTLGGFPFGGSIMWILIIALVGLAVYIVSRNRHQSVPIEPEGILQNRYARGEISREEYREMLKDLRG